MGLTNWLFGTCGRNHIGIYTCSRCGYELLRSGFHRGFIKTQSASFKSLLLMPLVHPTISARNHEKDEGGESKSGRKDNVTDFDMSMMEDFTRNANLGRIFHKKSIVRLLLSEADNHKSDQTTFEIACGKCGSSLGHQMFKNGYSTFDIKIDKVDLSFRPA